MAEDQTLRDIEASKLQSDFCKHIATLSTGAIILTVTFLEKIFTTPQWKTFVVISLVSFIVSILFSIFLSFIAVGVAEGSLELHSPKVTKWQQRSLFVMFSGFVLGLIGLTVFFIRNFM